MRPLRSTVAFQTPSATRKAQKLKIARRLTHLKGDLDEYTARLNEFYCDPDKSPRHLQRLYYTMVQVHWLLQQENFGNRNRLPPQENPLAQRSAIYAVVPQESSVYIINYTKYAFTAASPAIFVLAPIFVDYIKLMYLTRKGVGPVSEALWKPGYVPVDALVVPLEIIIANEWIYAARRKAFWEDLLTGPTMEENDATATSLADSLTPGRQAIATLENDSLSPASASDTCADPCAATTTAVLH